MQLCSDIDTLWANSSEFNILLVKYQQENI